MRESGILLHISSLPGAWGIGTMGTQAFLFVDFLKNAGQSCWQILPLTPTGFGDSPYQSCSAFAGNHYLIDLDELVNKGLLRPRELEEFFWYREGGRVDFGLQYRNKLRALRIAYERFNDTQRLDAFCREHGDWLPDYALYMALKDRHQGKPWYHWPHNMKFREPNAVWNARQELKDQIRFYCFIQYLFFEQWERLHAYATKSGVRIIGDVPIYVPYDSVEVWSSPEYFQLNDELEPIAVAGCPPDSFTEDGQLWGNPLYCWDRIEEDAFGWWIRRLKAAGRLYDTVRLDHFRGFDSYWSVPYGDDTARNGTWVKGPGISFVHALRDQLPELSVIAEDLGYLTPEVVKLRDASGYPGMKVLCFAFDSREPSDYLPHNYDHNSVCYTGTHDNVTMRQWFDTADRECVDYACNYMHLTEDEGLVWGMIRTAFASVSDLCIIPLQDYLSLGAEARMNLPGTLSSNNWTWRVTADACTSALAERIRALTAMYGRLGNRN